MKVAFSMSKKTTRSRMVIDDMRISFSIVFYFCALITNYTVKHVLDLESPLVRAQTSAIFMMVVGLAFIINLPRVFRRIGFFFLSSFLLAGSVFLLNILLFPSNIEYLLDAAFWFFFICLPLFLYYHAIYDRMLFLELLVKSAYYQIALGIVFLLTTNLATPVYDMVYSYLVLVPVILLIYKMFNQFKLIDLVLSMAGIIAIVILGSRGPLVSILVFSVTLLISRAFELHAKSLLIFIVALVLLGFVFVNLDLVLEFINSILVKHGISSRTLKLLMYRDTIDFSTGRNILFETTIEKITENPYFGYGLAGDRLFLNGTYPHNIVLEIVAQLGLVMGLIVLVILLFLWLKPIISSVDRVDRDLALIFFALGLVPLVMSGSYLTSGNFWIFMAICSSVVFSNLKVVH